MDRPSIPQASHSSANPYARIEIPAIGRVWQALQTLAARLQSRTLQISIRTLAAEAGLASAGHIPKHLRQLEADGHIAYDPQTSIVMLMSQDPDPEQVHMAAAIDLSRDQPDVADRGPRWSNHRAADPTGDRVKPPCMVVDHDLDQEEESCAPLPKIDQELYDGLMKKPGMNPKTAHAVAITGVGTLADFETDVAVARAMRKEVPVYYAATAWRNGNRLARLEDSYGAGDTGTARTDGRSNRRSGAGSAPEPRQADRRPTHQRRPAATYSTDRFAGYAQYLEPDDDPIAASA